VANHRAPKRRQRKSSRNTSASGRGRSAGKHHPSADTSARRLPKGPSVPALIGVAALVAAPTGAINLGGEAAVGQAQPAAVQDVNSLTGTDAIPLQRGSTQISRDAQRQQLEAAKQRKLQRAAEQAAEQRTAALVQLRDKAKDRAQAIKEDLWVLPTSDYHLTAGFGEVSGLWTSFHTGLDFAAPTGTPIVSVANGTVTYVGYDGSYGDKVVVALDDGTVTWYCHMTEFTVSVGDRVLQGQELGTVGSTGNTTGPHLHFEVHPDGGDPVDPYPFLIDHGVNP
jgi:murein DD-endopeptidase MepM/ murein hydrolase activator NlpD